MDLLIASIAKNRTVVIASFTVSAETPGGAATAARVTPLALMRERRFWTLAVSLARSASAAGLRAAADDIARIFWVLLTSTGGEATNACEASRVR